MELVTDRLVIDTVAEDDLDALVTARRSQPLHLARTEGTAGQVGLYDASKLGRDLAVADMDPARHLLAVRDRRDGQAIGLVDVLRVHPVDGVPWLGMVLVHADHEGRGVGREVVGAIARWARDALGAEVVRAGADEDDDAARAFLVAVGFCEVERRWRRGPAGHKVVVVHERSLRGGGAAPTP